MSGTVNKVILIGHLGDDVKMHYFEGGNSIGRAPMATNESYTNKTTNEKVTSTDWHNLIFRNKAAEIVEKYSKKGDKMYVEGKIKNRKWQDAEGNDRYSTEIHVTEFVFLQGKDDSTAGHSNNSQANAQKPQQQTAKPQNTKSGPAPTPPTEEEDDLPF